MAAAAPASYFHARPSLSSKVLATPLPHAGMGIASFVISLISGLSIALLIVVVLTFIQTPGVANGPDEETPLNYLIGTWMFASGVLSLVGVVFGIGGLFQKARRRALAVTGLLLNIALPLGLMFILVLAVSTGPSNLSASLSPPDPDAPSWTTHAAHAAQIGFVAMTVTTFVMVRRSRRERLTLTAAESRACARCGKPSPSGVDFCRRCGHSL